jgi:hypothetical protein
VSPDIASAIRKLARRAYLHSRNFVLWTSSGPVRVLRRYNVGPGEHMMEGRIDDSGLAPAMSRAVEEPLQIRIGSNNIPITMRTPGQDAELAAAGKVQRCKDRAGSRYFDDERHYLLADDHCSRADLDSRSDNRLGVDRLRRSTFAPTRGRVRTRSAQVRRSSALTDAIAAFDEWQCLVETSRLGSNDIIGAFLPTGGG